MIEQKNINKLDCEQVYKIWAGEPYLIKVLDVRPTEDFQKAHIPGATHLALDQVLPELESLGNRLAVIVAPDEVEPALTTQLKGFDNYVFMTRCHRWTDLKLPMTGQNNTNEFQQKGINMQKDIIFHQLFEPETSTYTYLIADQKTKEAAIIDPVLETVDRDLKLIDELGLKLVYVLDTHIHADHVTGAGELRKRTQAKTGVSHHAQVECVDLSLEDGQELMLGEKKIKVIATPGHTNTCLTFAFEGMIFTGDALMIRSCGRTDFQQGSSEKLYESVRKKLFTLPEETIIYPGHDYRGHTSSTIGLEKKFNPRLKESISKEEFKKIMSELKLANPKKIHEAVPANLACGKKKDTRAVTPQVVDGIPEVSVDDVHTKWNEVVKQEVALIDVRMPEEFNNELGHIAGSRLVTLGSELTQFLEKGDREREIIFICRSGGRSGAATAESIRLGYKKTANLAGGMILWNEKQYQVKRN